MHESLIMHESLLVLALSNIDAVVSAQSMFARNRQTKHRQNSRRTAAAADRYRLTRIYSVQ